MKFRKKLNVIRKSLSERKILFVLWPRQVGKTTLLKNIFETLQTERKLFLNLEILDHHRYFQNFTEITMLLQTNKFQKWEPYYLFLDEFHKVKDIDWIIKSLYDEYENIRIVLSGSNNIEINKNIKESFAGRKRVIPIFPLDFDEYIVWKENIDISEVSWFRKNPLNNGKLNVYLEECIIWWGYPEVVLKENPEEKKQVLSDIFSFWFNKDILVEIKEKYKFNDFLKQLAFRDGNPLNFSEIASIIGVSQPTAEYYFHLMFQSLLVYPVRPFSRNKLKEIIKMPKIYFGDIWFRNFLMGRFDFLNDEKWLLFENFIYSELLKSKRYYEDIKYWRTKNGSHEIDFILENESLALEVKYKDIQKKDDAKNSLSFRKDYPDMHFDIIEKTTFYNGDIFLSDLDTWPIL